MAKQLLNGDQLGATGGAWQNYALVWTGVSNPAIGNGTITARYKQIGKTIYGSVFIKTGSTTTFGSGEWIFSLPANAAGYSGGTNEPVIGAAWGLRSGVSYEAGTAKINNAANTAKVYSHASGGAWSASAPVTWLVGDIFGFNFMYEVA